MEVNEQEKREKIIKQLGMCDGELRCRYPNCPYDNSKRCISILHDDALDLLKTQEPRPLTKQDFDNNPMLDYRGALPAWIEHKYPQAYGGLGYWGSWELEDFNLYDTIRPWTVQPIEEQMEATPWL